MDRVDQQPGESHQLNCISVLPVNPVSQWHGDAFDVIHQFAQYLEGHKPQCVVAQGRSYLCKRLDLERRLAVVCPANLKYYTKIIDHCDISLVANHRAAFLVPVRPDHCYWILQLLLHTFPF